MDNLIFLRQVADRIRRETVVRRIDTIEKSAEQVLRVLDLRYGDEDISLDKLS